MTEPREREAYFVTAEVAAYCGVTNDGVLRWIKAGKLRAFATPGGHYRIRPDDFREFLMRYDIPIHEALFDPLAAQRTVLVVDGERGVRETRKALARIDPELRVEPARDGYAAGIQAGISRPDAIVVHHRMPRIDAVALCRSLRDNPRTQHARILVLTEFADDDHLSKIRASGADRCAVLPLDAARRTDELTRLVEPRRGARSGTARRPAASGPVPSR